MLHIKDLLPTKFLTVSKTTWRQRIPKHNMERQKWKWRESKPHFIDIFRWVYPMMVWGSFLCDAPEFSGSCRWHCSLQASPTADNTHFSSSHSLFAPIVTLANWKRKQWQKWKWSREHAHDNSNIYIFFFLKPLRVSFVPQLTIQIWMITITNVLLNIFWEASCHKIRSHKVVTGFITSCLTRCCR